MSDPRVIIRQALEGLNAGRESQAQSILARALQKQAQHPGLNQGMAIVASKLGRHDQAVYYIDRAIAADPSSATLWHHKGLLLTNTPRRAEAEAALRQAVTLEPGFAQGWEHLGMLLADLDRPGEAEAALEQSVTTAGSAAVTAGLALAYARVLAYVGRVTEAIKILRRVPNHDEIPEIVAQLAMLSHYDGNSTATEIASIHRRLGAIVKPLSPRPLVRDANTDRVLRVGLVSSDLREHSVASFARALVEHLPAQRFEVTSYSLGMKVDAVTRWFESASRVWRPMAGHDDGALAATIARDRIDIVIDLMGLSAQPRLSLLATRIAPVVVTAIGYPNTTGLPGVTHRLVDGVTDPAGFDALCTEALIRLDGCFLCYSPPDDARELRAIDATAPITFGSFNNLAKLSDGTLEMWSRILAELPASRLVLKARGLQDPQARDWWSTRLQRAGILPSRVELSSPLDQRSDHLAVYHRVHVALDPTPYAGTTTTCEALWMGVPVVTLPGGVSGADAHASRVGESLLRAVGLDRCIATGPDDYIARAVSIANDRGWIHQTRQTLRDRVRASVLCDGPGYGARLGAALRALWRDANAALPDA